MKSLNTKHSEVILRKWGQIELRSKTEPRSQNRETKPAAGSSSRVVAAIWAALYTFSSFFIVTRFTLLSLVWFQVWILTDPSWPACYMIKVRYDWALASCSRARAMIGNCRSAGKHWRPVLSDWMKRAQFWAQFVAGKWCLWLLHPYSSSLIMFF